MRFTLLRLFLFFSFLSLSLSPDAGFLAHASNKISQRRRRYLRLFLAVPPRGREIRRRLAKRLHALRELSLPYFYSSAESPACFRRDFCHRTPDCSRRCVRMRARKNPSGADATSIFRVRVCFFPAQFRAPQLGSRRRRGTTRSATWAGRPARRARNRFRRVRSFG